MQLQNMQVLMVSDLFDECEGLQTVVDDIQEPNDEYEQPIDYDATSETTDISNFTITENDNVKDIFGNIGDLPDEIKPCE